MLGLVRTLSIAFGLDDFHVFTKWCNIFIRWWYILFKGWYISFLRGGISLLSGGTSLLSGGTKYEHGYFHINYYLISSNGAGNISDDQ